MERLGQRCALSQAGKVPQPLGVGVVVVVVVFFVVVVGVVVVVVVLGVVAIERSQSLSLNRGDRS